jgi:hypothetical protein
MSVFAPISSIAAFPATLAAAPDGHRPLSPWLRLRTRRTALSFIRYRTGEGEQTIAAFTAEHTPLTLRLVDDPDLGPLDLLLAPSGDLVVASEHPFGATEAVATVRQYDASTGRPVRAFRLGESVQFRRPRGLRFGPGGNLFCAAQDEIVGFDFVTGACLGKAQRHAWPILNRRVRVYFFAEIECRLMCRISAAEDLAKAPLDGAGPTVKGISPAIH